MKVIIKEREVYRVSLTSDTPVRMFLPTGDFRTIEPDSDCLMLGRTIESTGLIREFERDRVSIEPFTLVPPDPEKSEDAHKRYAATMRHLHRGNVLFLSEVGIFSSPTSDRDKASDSRAAKKMDEVLVDASDVATEEDYDKEPVIPGAVEADVEVEEEQVERLDNAINRSPLTVLPGGESDTVTEDAVTEPEEVTEDDDLVESEEEESAPEEAVEEPTSKKKKRSRKKSKE